MGACSHAYSQIGDGGVLARIFTNRVTILKSTHFFTKTEIVFNGKYFEIWPCSPVETCLSTTLQVWGLPTKQARFLEALIIGGSAFVFLSQLREARPGLIKVRGKRSVVCGSCVTIECQIPACPLLVDTLWRRPFFLIAGLAYPVACVSRCAEGIQLMTSRGCCRIVTSTNP